MTPPPFSRRPAVLALVLCLFAPSALTVAPAYAQGGKTKGKVANTPNETLKGNSTALEGDVLVVNGTPVRLMGIDAPDPGQMCKNRYGRELDCFSIGRAVLDSLVKDEEVSCTIAERDRNGQRLGECRVRGVDLGAAMVARGWAFAYRSLSPAYASSEAFAQSRRLGLWAGKVEKPWQWRSRRLRETAR